MHEGDVVLALMVLEGGVQLNAGNGPTLFVRVLFRQVNASHSHLKRFMVSHEVPTTGRGLEGVGELLRRSCEEC